MVWDKLALLDGVSRSSVASVEGFFERRSSDDLGTYASGMLEIGHDDRDLWPDRAHRQERWC
jgi:hypothetical protein